MGRTARCRPPGRTFAKRLGRKQLRRRARGCGAACLRRSCPDIGKRWAGMAAIADFARKFGLVLKACNLSRGRLAQAVGIDKSVVSRWASGVQAPTDHNLTLLTEAVGRHRPG